MLNFTHYSQIQESDLQTVAIVGTVMSDIFQINIGMPTNNSLTCTKLFRPPRSILWNGFEYEPGSIIASALGKTPDR